MSSAALIDPFQRRIAYLRLSVTDFCNYRCVYCLPEGYQGCAAPDELSLAEIETLVRAFAESGTEKIRLTGGEPTMRRDIVEIAQICAAQAGIRKVAITTNAHRLDKLYRPLIDAGIAQFNISVDSFREETFRRMTGKNSLAGILQAVEKMLDEGFRHIKLNALLMRETAPETLADTLAFVKERPLTMRFIELMRTNDNTALYEKSHISAAEITQMLLAEGWVLRERTPLSGPALEFSHADYAGGIGIIAPYSKDFCSSCNRLRVTSTGKMHLCLFDSINYDLRDYLRAGDVQGLKAQLQRLIAVKPASHQLHSNDSGIMAHLAQIGG